MSRTLLAIFAHPDDETFGPGGTLAKYAAAGVAVHLVCATRGEVGESDPDGLGDCEDLACERELRCVVPPLSMAVGELTDSPSPREPRRTARTPGLWASGVVSAIMQTLLHWTVWLMPFFGLDPRAVGKNKDIDLRAALDHMLPTMTKIDVGLYYDAKQRAAACHQSQLSGPEPLWEKLPRWLTRRFQSTEAFHRAVPPFGQGERVEKGSTEVEKTAMLRRCSHPAASVLAASPDSSNVDHL